MDEDRAKRVVEALAKDRAARDASVGYEAGIAHGPHRELYWEECGIEQKVERVRDALLRMERLLEVMAKRSTEALKLSKVHSHDEHGTVLVPAIAPHSMTNEVEMNVRGIFWQLHGAPPQMHATIAGSLLKR